MEKVFGEQGLALQWDFPYKQVVPEKIHTPSTDGILEILVGEWSDSENPGGSRGWTWKSLLQESFRPIVHAIRTFSSVTLQHS